MRCKEGELGQGGHFLASGRTSPAHPPTHPPARPPTSWPPGPCAGCPATPTTCTLPHSNTCAAAQGARAIHPACGPSCEGCRVLLLLPSLTEAVQQQGSAAARGTCPNTQELSAGSSQKSAARHVRCGLPAKMHTLQAVA
jgi:hypothetical protein